MIHCWLARQSLAWLPEMLLMACRRLLQRGGLWARNRRGCRLPKAAGNERAGEVTAILQRVLVRCARLLPDPCPPLVLHGMPCRSAD